MHNSQEELLEMQELKSPLRDKFRTFSKRKNKVHTPPFTSPSHGADNEVTSLFSVKKASNMSETSENTISEMSDGVFSAASGTKSKNKQISRNKKKQLGESIERVQNECAETDSRLQRIREKYPSSRFQSKVNSVDFFSSENSEHGTDGGSDGDSNPIVFRRAESMSVNMDISETSLYFVPNRCYTPFRRGDGTEGECMDNDGLFVYSNKDISMAHLNLMRRRLERDDDRQWFTSYGHLILLPNPLTPTSIKSNLKVKKDGLEYKSPSPTVDLDEILVIRDRVLEVTLSSIRFIHHPLFSLEHVLAQRLLEVFEVYADLTRSSKVQKLKNKMEAVRHARKQKDESTATATAQTLRDDLLNAGKLERESTVKILALWKTIKKLRRHQNYISTTVRVAIKKETTDAQRESVEYERSFADLLEDVLDEHRRGFNRKMKRYRMRLRSREETSSVDASDSDEFREHLAEPVYDVDEERLERHLRVRYEDSFKPPGEPKIYLFLKNDAIVSDEVEEMECARRKVVTSTKFYTKIFCAGLLVCKTKPVLLSDRFLLDLNEVFSVQLGDVPKFLTVEIIEQPKSLLKKKICELQLMIPKLSELSGQSSFQESPFQKSEIVHYKHAGVGSGYTFQKLAENIGFALDVDIDKELNTYGLLKYKLAWTANGQAATSTEQTATQFDVPKILNKWGAVETNRLQFWIEGLKLDPQDPRNSPFFDCISADGLEDFAPNRNDYFRLSPYVKSLTFCDIVEIDRNVRLQCLRLRNRNEIEFDGVLIASRAREVPLGPLRDFHQRKSVEVVEEYDNDDCDSGKRRLNQIYRKIFQMCKGTGNNLSYESIVDEKSTVYVEQFIQRSLNGFLNWFREKPKVIRRVARRETASQDARLGPRSRIDVKVISGKSLPGRSSVDEVQPFVQIEHEECLVRTSVGRGRDPFWNQSVELSLSYQHAEYLTPNALQGTVSVNVYDLIESRTTDDGENVVFWLGCVNIPLVALATGAGIRGRFKVTKPSVILGYVDDGDTYIEMDLRILPQVPVMEPHVDDLHSNETPYMKEYILGWNDWYNSNFPTRKFNALAMDSLGRTSCLTRYIRPLEPPQVGEDTFEVTPEQCLRYVSLVPFMIVNRFYQNIWLTTEQLLHFNMGHVVDHCVSLTCFLLALKVDAWLLLGEGIPQGITAYVLICEQHKDNKAFSILDVVNNEKISLLEPSCPLERVFCLVNGHNIWANTQRTDNSALLRFDLDRRSDWSALFDNNVTAPSIFVNNRVNFSAVIDVGDLETLLERKIKRAFSRWRATNRTIFHHRVTASLKNCLKTLEQNVVFYKSNADILSEINKIFSHTLITGIVLNVSFSDMSHIVNKIKQTQLHVQSPETTEFTLAVKMKSYPGKVISVWVFLGVLHEKNED